MKENELKLFLSLFDKIKIAPSNTRTEKNDYLRWCIFKCLNPTLPIKENGKCKKADVYNFASIMRHLKYLLAGLTIHNFCQFTSVSYIQKYLKKTPELWITVNECLDYKFAVSKIIEIFLKFKSFLTGYLFIIIFGFVFFQVKNQL